MDSEATLPLRPATPAPSAPARRFGDYELLDEIARGGMGIVYRARQVSLNRIVALKMILAGEFASEEDVRRFRSEAEAAAALDHPGIVPVFDVGQHDGQHYFTMGCVCGQSLQARLSQGPLPAREAARIMLAAAEAVQYAHDKGVIHRDLKPGNILIDEHGQPRVTDFGLAKRLAQESGLTATGQVLGTPSYMPPEQAAGRSEQNGVTADVYALGAVLYALLVGRPPFQAAGPAETLMQVLQQDPIPPRQLNLDVPVDLNTLVLKCLEKSPSQRYATARELGDELRRYLNDEPILAHPIGRSQRMWRWCKRQPKVAALGASVAMLLVFLTVAAPMVAAHQARLRSVAEANAAQAQRETDRANNEARQAEAALYRARLSEIRALRLAPSPGWSEICAENLRRNAEKDIPVRNIVELRTAAVDCMGEIDAIQEKRLSGHMAGVWSLDFSPDGSLLASADYGGITRIWDLRLGRPVHETRDAAVVAARRHAAGSPFPAVRFHPDGQQIVYATWSRAVAAVPIRPGARPITGVSSSSEAQYIAFDRKGARMAVGWSDGRIVIYATDSGKPLREVRRNPPGTTRREVVALSPDGETFACAGGDYTVLLHSTTNESAPAVLGHHHGPVTSLCFSPDGRLLATSSEDHTAKLFDVGLRKETAVLLGHKARVQCVAFSGDGRIVATASDDRSARLWRTYTGEPVMTLRPELGPLLSVAMSENGERLAAASENDIALYRIVRNRARINLYGHTYAVTSLAFRPGKPELVTASWDNTFIRWDLPSQRREQSWPTPPSTHPGNIAVSPSGELLATGLLSYSSRQSTSQYPVPVWNLAGANVDRSLDGLSADCSAVAFSPSGELIAAAAKDGSVSVWEARTGKPIRQWKEPRDWVAALGFLADGRSLVTACYSRRAVVRDIATGNATHECTLPEVPVQIAVSCDRASLAIAGTRGGVTVFSLPALVPLAALDHEHGGPIASAAFSSDGRLLATGGNDRQVIVWDARGFRKLLLLPKQQGPVFCLAFEPDELRLAIGGVEEHVTIWDLREVRRQLALLGLDWDNQTLATARPDGTR